MSNKVASLIKLIKKMSESKLDEALTFIETLTQSKQKKEPKPPCPYCKSPDVKRNGHDGQRQRFLCNICHRSFRETTNTIMIYSHFGEAVWKQMISDTIKSVPLKTSAKSLKMSHATAFAMRHKILLAMQDEAQRQPTVLSDVCEIDDTFVLESYKGSKLPQDFWRASRKHGAVAQKRGISNEYVCISTGIQRKGPAYSMSVTRATPSRDDIDSVFKGHLGEDVLILCDGGKSYNVLAENYNCSLMTVDSNKGFANINTSNGFHSFIKERYNQFRGVATKYLNRYNVLFSNAYRNIEGLIDKTYNMLCVSDQLRPHIIKDVNTLNLLSI